MGEADDDSVRTFLSVLTAVQREPYSFSAQITALEMVGRMPGDILEERLSLWVKVSGFGDLTNAAAILSDCFETDAELYRVCSVLAAIAVRLGRRDLAFKLFGSCFGGEASEQMTTSDVVAEYSEKAGGYDDNLNHVVAVHAFISFVVSRPGIGFPLDIVDIPCGTGLAGPILRPLARRLIASDLSPDMAEMARQRGCYDDVIIGDLTVILPHLSADMVFCHGSLYYFRDIGPVVESAAAALRTGGRFVFTDYPAPQGVMVTIGGNHRFGHAPDLVRSILASYGFEEIAWEMGLTCGLPSLFWIFRKR
jgi:SAM-dependent methyltransferase